MLVSEDRQVTPGQMKTTLPTGAVNAARLSSSGIYRRHTGLVHLLEGFHQYVQEPNFTGDLHMKDTITNRPVPLKMTVKYLDFSRLSVQLGLKPGGVYDIFPASRLLFQWQYRKRSPPQVSTDSEK